MALSPDVTVEIAFTSGYTTAAASRTWTDVSAYVESDRSISIQRGRPDQFSAPQPSRLTLTLDNTDGRFTPENSAGAYYPNVKKGRPIRVRVKPVGAGAYVDRFMGYIDEWPVEWPGDSQTYSTVTITATSRQARLGRTAAFKSIVEEEYLYDVPVLYFPLGEPQGATTAGNIAPGRSEVLTVNQFGTGGTLEFGAGIGPGTDDLTAPILTPVDTSNGLYLTTPLVQPLATSATVLQLECWLVGSTSSTSQQVIAGLFNLATYGSNDTTGEQFFYIAQDTTSNGNAIFAKVSGGGTNVISGGALNDGALHHVVARATIAGGAISLDLIVDGSVSSVAPTAWTVPQVPAYKDLTVGGFPAASRSRLYTGTIAHVAVYTGLVADARFIQHYNAGANGFTTDASGARVARYARLAGVPTAEISTETGVSPSIAHKDTTGELPSALMQAVADTEDGVVFDGKDGTLTFHARSHRYGATSAFTLSVAAGDVEGGLTPKLDDQHLTNDMTASRPNGITVRSTNDASIAEYGYYRETVEILTTSDNEVQARADWEVQRFGTPRVTVPNLAVDLLTCSSGLITSLLAADIGTKFTVTGLPSQAPSSTMTFFIEGVSERIGAESYGIEFNVSAAAYANVWQLDSASYSQLDSSTVLAY